MEPSLFDDLPAEADNNIVYPKKSEPLEPPQIEGVGTEWLEDFEIIEDLIGAEAAWKLAEAFAGSAIYIPKNILTNRNYNDIRKKFKAGSNYRELSLEYGYTETHVRNIIHKKQKE